MASAPTAELSVTPSVDSLSGLTVAAGSAVPESASAVGLLVGTDGDVPDGLGFDRARLHAAGFTGEAAQTLVLPTPDGATLVAVGIGGADDSGPAGVRNAAAAFARAAGSHGQIALHLGGLADVEPAAAAQAAVEGMLLARYRYDPLRAESKATPLEAVALVGGRRATRRRCRRASIGARLRGSDDARPRPGQQSAQPPQRDPDGRPGRRRWARTAASTSRCSTSAP